VEPICKERKVTAQVHVITMTAGVGGLGTAHVLWFGPEEHERLIFGFALFLMCFELLQ